MTHEVTGRREVPRDNGGPHDGKKAVCVRLESGRIAWGFGVDEASAEADALVRVMDPLT